MYFEKVWASDCSWVDAAGTKYIRFVYCFLKDNDAVLRNAQKGAAQPHVHAKDVCVDTQNVRRNGVLDTRHYSHTAERAWTFRTVGDGMDEQTWKRIIAALRLAGYDGVLSLEHEDLLLSRQEGAERAAAFLHRLIPRQQPERLWWA